VPLFRRKEGARPSLTTPRSDWRSRLADPHLTEDVFTAAVADAFREASVLSVEVLAPRRLRVRGPRGETQPLLDNLWAFTQAASPADRVARVEQQVAASVETHTIGDAPLGVDAILPLVRDEVYRSQLQGEVPGRPLVADLWVFYGFDSPRNVRVVSEPDRARLGLSLEELHATALRNLRAAFPSVATSDADAAGTRILLAGGDYDASLLLLPEIWRAQARGMRGPLVAVAPTRDVVAFADGANERAVETLLLRAHLLHERGDRLISRTMLRWQDPDWAVYDGPGNQTEPGVQNPTSVDFIGAAPDGTWGLVMVQARDWDDLDWRAQQLRTKVNAYRAFVASGQLFAQFPDARGKPIRFELLWQVPPPKAFGKVIGDIAGMLKRESGIEFRSRPTKA
jgi:hypothetical protein